EEQRVSVGRGSRNGLCADDAARAALVVDDDLLAEPLGKLEGDHSPDHVVAAAGRKGNDHANRLAGVSLRLRRARIRGRENKSEDGEGYGIFHRSLYSG